MSLFTWKRNKKGKSKEKEKSGVDLKNKDFEDEDFELPPSLTRNRERNLSISRSGRHKVKKQSRTSVMSDEVYSPDAAPKSPPAWPQENTNHHASSPSASSTPHQSNIAANQGASYHCRDSMDNTRATGNLSGSQRMAHAPTAV